MKSIGIITDSTSSITPQAAKELDIRVLPMPFYIDGKCHYENAGLSRSDFFACQAAGKDIHTSQPSPEEVTWQWDHALKEYKHILYFPISSGLSGSYSTACILAQEHPYTGRVFVVDAGRVSTLLHQSILDALQLIDEGYKAEEIKHIIEKSRSDFSIYIAVEQLDSLCRGGSWVYAILYCDDRFCGSFGSDGRYCRNVFYRYLCCCIPRDDRRRAFRTAPENQGD